MAGADATAFSNPVPSRTQEPHQTLIAVPKWQRAWVTRAVAPGEETSVGNKTELASGRLLSRPGKGCTREPPRVCRPTSHPAGRHLCFTAPCRRASVTQTRQGGCTLSIVTRNAKNGERSKNRDIETVEAPANKEAERAARKRSRCLVFREALAASRRGVRLKIGRKDSIWSMTGPRRLLRSTFGAGVAQDGGIGEATGCCNSDLAGVAPLYDAVRATDSPCGVRPPKTSVAVGPPSTRRGPALLGVLVTHARPPEWLGFFVSSSCTSAVWVGGF